MNSLKSERVHTCVCAVASSEDGGVVADALEGRHLNRDCFVYSSVLLAEGADHLTAFQASVLVEREYL